MRQLTMVVVAFAAFALFGTSTAHAQYRSSHVSVNTGGFSISIGKGPFGKHVGVSVWGNGSGFHYENHQYRVPRHRRHVPVYRGHRRHTQVIIQQPRVYHPPVVHYPPVQRVVYERVIVGYETVIVGYDRYGNPCYERIPIVRTVARTVTCHWSNGHYRYHDNQGVLRIWSN